MFQRPNIDVRLPWVSTLLDDVCDAFRFPGDRKELIAHLKIELAESEAGAAWVARQERLDRDATK